MPGNISPMPAKPGDRPRKKPQSPNGWPLAWNTTFQYRVFKYLWPEFETNYTWQSYGSDTGHQMLFLTPGLLIGRIPIHDRIGLTFGAGYQVAATFHRNYNHNVILTARIPF